ncbi:UNVERIFIED_ORG: response regulator [Lacrimispora saccharolytica]|nr:transcriptional regulatory protein [Clostridium sp. CAG:149]
MYSVIIVEDDPMVASINRQYVELEPSFSVKQIFKSGQDALSWLSREEVDLIILDYYMPLMTGQEFIDRLHSMGKAPSVIMVTSAGDSAIVQELLSRGVLDYLVKPFERSRFRQALSRFAQTRSCLDGSPELNQAEIDRLLSHAQPPSSFQPELAKGLSETTLNLIRNFLQNRPGESFSSEQIAEQVCLSRITIRRYMNYMLETGEIISSVDYQTGGRPSIKYTCSGHVL